MQSAPAQLQQHSEGAVPHDSVRLLRRDQQVCLQRPHVPCCRQLGPDMLVGSLASWQRHASCRCFVVAIQSRTKHTSVVLRSEGPGERLADLPLTMMPTRPGMMSRSATCCSTASVHVVRSRRRNRSCRSSSAALAGRSSLPRSSIAAGRMMRLPGQSASCRPPCPLLIPCVISMPALGTSTTSTAAACRATECSTEGARRHESMQCVRGQCQQQPA